MISILHIISILLMNFSTPPLVLHIFKCFFASVVFVKRVICCGDIYVVYGIYSSNFFLVLIIYQV